MNWHETETRAQILLSCAIMICVFVGTFVIFTMNRREAELIRHIKALSEVNDAHVKMAADQANAAKIRDKVISDQIESARARDRMIFEQVEASRIQSRINEDLTREISEIHRHQDILKRVAERIGIHNGQEPKKNP